MNFIRLYISNGSGVPVLAVEMPAATTGRYAAKRIVEALGYDPDEQEWALMGPQGQLDPDRVVAGYEGATVYLM